MLNKSDDDIDFLVKDEMMCRGFRWLSERSPEFRTEVANLRKSIATISDAMPIRRKELEAVSIPIDKRLEDYIKYLQNAQNYVKKNLDGLEVEEAELLLAEIYYSFYKIYYLYNEVFTYGAIEPILVQEIKSRGLNLQDALTQLTSYKGTAIDALYGMLLDVEVPQTLRRFMQKRRTDMTFSKKIDALLESASLYTENDITPSELYEMIVGAREHAAHIQSVKQGKAIDGDLARLYIFIVSTQRKLYIANNLCGRMMVLIFKRFGDLKKKYDGRGSKARLFEIYFEKLDGIKKLKLSEPNVYYKNMIFNLTEGKHLSLSRTGARVVEAILERHAPKDIYLVDACDAAKELKGADVLEDRIAERESNSYIFMLELALSCNLNCTICFNRGFKRKHIVTAEQWQRIIRMIPTKSKIVLFGGEPFYYPKIGEMIDFIQRTNRNEKRGWTLESFTNGALTERICTVLKGKEPLKLIFSIDGMENVHDKIRGSGTFGRAVESIKWIKANTRHEIVVNSVVTSQNYENINEFIQFFKRLGVDEITFADLHLAGNAENHRDYLVATTEKVKILNRLGSCNDEVVRNDYRMGKAAYPNSCGIGFNRIYVRSDGLVNGCSELDIAESNIFDAELDEEGIIRYPRLLIPKFERNEFDSVDSACAKCGLLYLCGGGCRARAFKETGNINNCDTTQRRDITFVLDSLSANSQSNR